MASLKYFAVTGRGFFPDDMLRYDCAEAMNEEEYHKITQHRYDPSDEKCHGDQYEAARDTVTILLTSSLRSAPTEERWASFGWVVTDVVWDGPEHEPRGLAPGEHWEIPGKMK